VPFSFTAVFFPMVRFAGHAAATSVGFVIVVLVTLPPIYLIKAGLADPAHLDIWNSLETAVLYLDIGLYVITGLLWALVFVVEEFVFVVRAIRAVRKELGW
jgi:hypothetical protein